MPDLHQKLTANPRRNMLFRALLFMSVTAALASLMATVVHWNQASPGPIDLIIPPFVGIGFSLVSIYLYRQPLRYQRAAWINFLLGLGALAAPAWYYPYVAYREQRLLVDLLPPVAAALFPLLLTLAVFVRPHRPLLTSVLSWVVVAAPILVYLVWHPDELLSPRGHDLAMTLGPVMFIVIAYLAVHKQLEAMAVDLHQQHQALKQIAERDGLTQLYNRRAGEQALLDWAWQAQVATEISHKSFGIILFDVDHFKRINDLHGHATGDDVLRSVAQAASEVIGESEVLVRWGGEEFLLLSKASEHKALSQLAESIRVTITRIDRPKIGPISVSLGASLHVGLSHVPGSENPTTAEVLEASIAASVDRADQAMYRAKRNGRNRTEFA
jgi:diguanylate cyclase (GGDEF)-like protein